MSVFDDSAEEMSADGKDIIVSGERYYHMMRIVIESNAEVTDELLNTVHSVNSCKAAKQLKKDFPIRTAENNRLKISDIPDPIRNLLIDLPVGRVTPPFGNAGDEINFLMICGQSS